MEPVRPLRIAKPATPSTSPSKTSSATMATSRPLAEVGSTERRRNSPSYNQATRKMIVSHDTSPYTENSPPCVGQKGQKRDFWQGLDMLSPNRTDFKDDSQCSSSILSTTPRRRPSVERLAQVSPVRKSNIFALENKDTYDPNSVPIVERPIANRPMSQSVANSPFTRYDSIRKENNPLRTTPVSGRDQSKDSSSTALPTSSPLRPSVGDSFKPSAEKRDSPSPTKSSLARTSMFDFSPPNTFDPENGTWSDGEDHVATPRSAQRHSKNVTFHEEPPVVNEYEEQTPEPSLSLLSDREGSWDSEDFDDQNVSFERSSSAGIDVDDSFDADLENADKTPVVLPENWARMTPEAARTDLVDVEDDVFQGEDNARSASGHSKRSASDGEARPLPPLPGLTSPDRGQASSIQQSTDRGDAKPRRQSHIKRASCSKDEILNMIRQSSLSLEERLQLVAGRSNNAELPAPDHSETHQPAEDSELFVSELHVCQKVEVHATEDEIGQDSVADLSELVNAPPRISRESILRKVRSSRYDYEDESESDASDFVVNAPVRPPISELAKLHPDEPVPSRENSRDASSSYSADALTPTADDGKGFVKDEPIDDEPVDMSSIPAAIVEAIRSPSRLDQYSDEAQAMNDDVQFDSESDLDRISRESSIQPDAEGTMIHHEVYDYEDEDGEEEYNDGKETLQDAMALLTVKDYSTPNASTSKDSTKQGMGDFLGLPACLASPEYDFGMKEYITPSPPTSSNENDVPHLKTNDMPILAPPPQAYQENGAQIGINVGHEISPPRTPDSVIHHSDEARPISPVDELTDVPVDRFSIEEPVVPERQATIRTNGRFKTRKSATQADLTAMAEQRRLVSSEIAVPVPALPSYIASGNSEVGGSEEALTTLAPENSDAAPPLDNGDAQTTETFKARRKSRKSGGRMDLMLDTSTFSIGDQDILGLDQEFDRVIEAQKKGYLTRQNTKLVVASNRNFSGESQTSVGTACTTDDLPTTSPVGGRNPASRGTRSANSSPRKRNVEPYLQTEPWNSKTRRKSVRKASSQQATGLFAPAPPLPGKESALDAVNEDLTAANLDENVPEGFERGRLFVKVVGVKGLDLPLPRNERVPFQLTLDNGLHCVTTADMELSPSATIGQEFELVVLNDLEFQLTLTTNLPKPPPTQTPTLYSSPSKPKSVKQSGFSRLLSSPKKRAEKERQEREAIEAESRRVQEEARRKRASVQPTAWDLLRELVNESDGSFARAYVNLKAHEQSCFGRQLTVNVPCYNEWALEQDRRVINSVRSKRGTNTGPIRRPPYVVGHLQLQLLYVPKPKDATDADLPKSMSGAIREMTKAAEVQEVVYESLLSQQGGDCIHWRRRFFRLQGPKLTAYHEHTRQKRAVINLSKASRLVDDRSTLVADPTGSPSKSRNTRRKSAFAEEDEGYQYVEEGFRIRFLNGETIDFYADSRAEKDQWMNALSQVIGKPDTGARATRWTDVVLARERSVNGTAVETNAQTTPYASQESAVEAKVTSSAPAPTLAQQGVAAPASETTKAPAQAQAPARSPSKASSTNKPLPPNKTQAMSKSVPSSPMKRVPVPRPTSVGSAASSTTSTTIAATTPKLANGAKTPPLQPRRGHRARDAVKSMIF